MTPAELLAAAEVTLHTSALVRGLLMVAGSLCVLLMAISFSTSILLVVRNPWWQVGLALFALCMCGWLWRLPSRDAPGRSPPTP